MQPQKFLKVLVIGLGVAIVLALGLVMYGFSRLNSAAEAPLAGQSGAAGNVSPTDLGQPVGTDVMQVMPLGSSRLVVSLRGGGLPDRFVVFDLKSGRVVGTTYATRPNPAP